MDSVSLAMSDLDVAEQSVRNAAKLLAEDGRKQVADRLRWKADGIHAESAALTMEELPPEEFVKRGMAIMGEDD